MGNLIPGSRDDNRPPRTPGRYQGGHGWIGGAQGDSKQAIVGVQLSMSALEQGADFSRLDEIAEVAGMEFVKATTSLAERFGVPPFSVLDARQGYWQERKRAWISLGIKSELGRAGDLQNQNIASPEEAGSLGLSARLLARIERQRVNRLSPGGSPRPATKLGPGGRTLRGDGQGRPLPGVVPSAGNRDQHSRLALSHKQAKVYNTQGWVDQMGIKGNAIQQSGTSIFDPVLCEMACRWFAPPGGTVLDPFAGGSVRGIVASYLGHPYIGIDLRPEQVQANQEQWKDIRERLAPAYALNVDALNIAHPVPIWTVGDARNLATLNRQFDFIFTCPPYWNLEIYSDDPADLSNCPRYEDFLEAHRYVIFEAVKCLRPNRFACYVVGDLRDARGFYCNLTSDTIRAFADVGMGLYNEAIILTSIGSLPIRVAGQFRLNRKLGRTHQFLLIFFKGDPARIKDFGEVYVPTWIPDLNDLVIYREEYADA